MRYSVAPVSLCWQKFVEITELFDLLHSLIGSKLI